MSCVRILVLLALCICSSFAAINRKQLAGPPSDFNLHVVPEPREAALRSASAMIFLSMDQDLAGDDGTSTWDGEIAVDSSTMFMISLYFPFTIKNVILKDPENSVFNTDGLAVQENLQVLGSEVPVTTYVIRNPEVGLWSLHVEADSSAVKQSSSELSDAIIVVFNESPLVLVSNLNTYDLTVGTDIGLEVTMEDAESPRSSLKDVIFDAKLGVTFPSGQKVEVNMHDDGLRSDKAADDGEFTATVKSVNFGNYLAQASVSGLDAAGNKFLRTAQHSFAVTSVEAELLGTASSLRLAPNRMVVSLDVNSFTTADLSAYAEVWGFDAKTGKSEVAVCWIGGIVNVLKLNGRAVVELELDLDWIKMASATGPFTLKNVVLQAVESWAVVSTVENIPVKTAPHIDVMLQYLAAEPRTVEISERMLQGVRPSEFTVNASNPNAAQAGIILLHGYCSATNPWAESTSDFTHASYFLNPSASISNDAFAQRVIAWSSNLGPVTGVGHSQGGLVLTHIKNFYWSGFDTITSTGRVIQSVGSPYQGCTAAGSLANIGKIFGVGCGTNVDLTTDGSLLWIRGITAQTRSKMYYYTSTYKQGKALGDYCNLAMNAILEWPNDGTSELDYTVLPGAINGGNKEQWCHISGFKYPAQTIDHVQNKAINGYAAR